jgi:release factor glutamine methyltransferase
MATADDSVGMLLIRGTERLRDSGSPSPRLDAELLLAYLLGTDRTGLLAHPDIKLPPSRLAQFDESVGRRAAGEPVAYIRGIKEFFGYVFVVDDRALIPRPETELIVEMALARIQGVLTGGPRPAGTPPVLVADVGTGSGAIAISLALESRKRRYGGHVRFIASDIDEAALGLAKENGVGHGVADIVDFAVADLLPPSAQPFDLVVANLPYIRTDDVPTLPVAASFEPAQALDGGPDGLSIIGRLLEELPGQLAARGDALLEIGADHEFGIRDLAARSLPGWSVTVHRDLAGLPRVAELRH